MSLNDSDLQNMTIRVAHRDRIGAIEYDAKTGRFVGVQALNFNLLFESLVRIFKANLVFVNVSENDGFQENQLRLFRNEADFITDYSNQQLIGHPELEFSTLIGNIFMTLISLKPRSIEKPIFQESTIFDNCVWILIFATFWLTPLLVLSYHKGTISLGSFKKALYYFFVNLVGQSFVLSKSFTGLLLSKLTLPDKPLYFETFNDVVDDPHMTVIGMWFAYNIVKQQRGEELALKKVRRFKDDYVQDIMDFISNDICMACDILHAVAAVDQLNLCDEAKDELYKSKEFVAIVAREMITRKNAPKLFRQKFLDICLYIVESGISDHYTAMHVWKYERCFKKISLYPEGVVPLPMSSLYFPLTILAIGTLSSFLSYVVQLIYNKKQTKCSPKT